MIVVIKNRNLGLIYTKMKMRKKSGIEKPEQTRDIFFLFPLSFFLFFFFFLPYPSFFPVPPKLAPLNYQRRRARRTSLDLRCLRSQLQAHERRGDSLHPRTRAQKICLPFARPVPSNSSLHPPQLKRTKLYPGNPRPCTSVHQTRPRCAIKWPAQASLAAPKLA